MSIFDEPVSYTPAPKRDRERLRAEARAKAVAGHKAHVRRQSRNLAPKEEDLISWDDHTQMEDLAPAGAPASEHPLPTPPAVGGAPLDFEDMLGAHLETEGHPADEPDMSIILGPSTPRPTFWVFLVAAVLGGILGIDRFLGKRYLLGALKLLTLGGLGIWALWDIAAILSGTYTIRGSVTLAGTRKQRLFATGAVGVALLLVGALLIPQVVSAVDRAADQPVVEAPRSTKVLELRSTDPKLLSLDLPVPADLTLTAMVTSSGEGSLVVTAPDRSSSFHELVDGQQTVELEVHAGIWNLDIDCPAGCAVDVYSPPVATP